MLPAIVALGLVGAGTLYWKLSAPKRAFSRTHVAPIQKKIDRLVEEEKKVSDNIEELQIDCNLFTRDFNKETGLQKKRISEGHRQNKEWKQKISDSYDDLERAKADLESWHNWSKGNIFGNGGRKLPQSGIFSQSLNERDSLKSKRDDAGAAIGHLKREQNEHYQNTILDGKNKLNEIKNAKIRLRKLRIDKCEQKEFQRQINELLNVKHDKFKEIRKLENKIKELWHDYKSGKIFESN